MTKEELKQEAEEYGIDLCAYCRECEGEKPCQHKLDAMHGYQDGLKAREKRIAELETRCNELFLQTCEQAELIEKMKCCSNCKNEGDYKEPYRYGTGWCNICKRHKVAKGNFDKWEIKEK